MQWRYWQTSEQLTTFELTKEEFLIQLLENIRQLTLGNRKTFDTLAVGRHSNVHVPLWSPPMHQAAQASHDHSQTVCYQQGNSYKTTLFISSLLGHVYLGSWYNYSVLNICVTFASALVSLNFLPLTESWRQSGQTFFLAAKYWWYKTTSNQQESILSHLTVYMYKCNTTCILCVKVYIIFD